MSFPVLGRVTRVEITDNHNKPILTIDDERQIVKIVAFVDGQRSGWGAPWAGIPIPEVVANFYDGEEFQGHFGVGPTFFEAQREGDFASKSATGRERRGFLALIGVPYERIEK